ncbi:histidine kinase dimerization/phospho-acceptor domain-containing protein, partial [Klebsiella pneumoniae]
MTQTNDLRPIEVSNNDEMAQLTTSFNQMLEALQESRSQQAQFVADAGHELKTPLTSMRTNIELLMMLNRAGGGFG